ncbi:MAG TPA: dihydrofolate reductase family protein [Dehalococcoidales bacterium]
MGTVAAGFSMSLDGFIAGPNDDVERLFKWYSMGDIAVEMPSGDREFQLSPASAEVVEDATNTVGALVYGRRTFDIAHAWGGRHPLNVPMVILTHTIPQEWVKPDSPFTFVMNGIQSAIDQAKKIAGNKTVAVGSGTTTQQCLHAGLLDEIHIDLVPVLLGEGIRLFDRLGAVPVELENISVVEAPGVTHLTFRVVK